MPVRLVARDLSRWSVHRICLLLLQLLIILYSCLLLYHLTWGKGALNVWFVVQFIFSIIFFKLYYKSLRDLYYSFWGLSAMLFFYLMFTFMLLLHQYGLSYFLLGHIFLLGFFWSICLLISSPVYYPIINWWEFDFRYRVDLKVFYQPQISLTGELGEKIEGRLSDLRREAGCLVLFKLYELSQDGLLYLNFKDQDYQFKVRLITLCEMVPGRGYHYGLKFLSQTVQEQRKLGQIMRYWKIESRKKIKEKFVGNC